MLLKERRDRDRAERRQQERDERRQREREERAERRREADMRRNKGNIYIVTNMHYGQQFIWSKQGYIKQKYYDAGRLLENK